MSKFTLILIFLGFSFAVFLQGEEKKDISDNRNANEGDLMSILASVNAEPISLSDILPQTRQAEYQLYAAYSGDELYEKVRSVRLKAVDEVINRKLAMADYKLQTFKIPSQAIESELDNIAERMGCRSRSEFVSELRRSGTSLEEVRSDLESNLASQLMAYQQAQVEVYVSPKDVYEYFQQEKEKLRKNETLELGLILVDKGIENHEKIVEEIKESLNENVDNFSELAKKYSSAPAAKSGGNLGVIERKRLRKEFALAIKEFKKDNYYGPIETSDAIAFIKIISHQKPQDVKFADVSNGLRIKLEQERNREVIQRYYDNLRKNAIIRYFF